MSGHKPALYRDRHDFRRSPEPAGRNPGNRPVFVIQAHDARRLHYDFRLEVAGVLKSWAIPRGPIPDPRRKRLAVRTEDHPLDYADFEGSIPAEQYGGGTVLVWDAGTWRNRSRDGRGRPLSADRALKAGKLSFELWGHKLRGGWALVRMKGQGKNWLLIKEKDAASDGRRNPVSTQPRSVLSGRTLTGVRRDTEQASPP